MIHPGTRQDYAPLRSYSVIDLVAERRSTRRFRLYYRFSAAASLVAQMGCGSFIVRYGALR
jgi:hypothetical protein